MTKHRQGDQTIAAKDLGLGEDTLVSGAGEDSVAGEDSGLSTGYEGGRDELHDSVDPASGGLTQEALDLRKERRITQAGLDASGVADNTSGADTQDDSVG